MKVSVFPLKALSHSKFWMQPEIKMCYETYSSGAYVQLKPLVLQTGENLWLKIFSGERLIRVCTLVLEIPLANLVLLPRAHLTWPEDNRGLKISWGSVLEKAGALSKTCLSSYLLEAPKFDVRKEYDFRRQNLDCLGRKVSLKRGLTMQNSKDQEKTLQLLSLYNFLVGLKGCWDLWYFQKSEPAYSLVKAAWSSWPLGSLISGLMKYNTWLTSEPVSDHTSKGRKWMLWSSKSLLSTESFNKRKRELDGGGGGIQGLVVPSASNVILQVLENRQEGGVGSDFPVVISMGWGVYLLPNPCLACTMIPEF